MFFSRDEIYTLAVGNGVNSNYLGSSMNIYQQPQYRLNYDRLGNYRSLVMQKYKLHLIQTDTTVCLFQ